MDICRSWLKGDCFKHRKGTCDKVHIQEFCANSKECKDKTCLEGFEKRHVIKCSKRKRWKNGEECQFPNGKWKACSFYHPELGKVKIRKKDCKKCDDNETELKNLKSIVESIQKDLSSNSINIVKDETAAEKMETPTAEKIEILTKELEELKAKHKTFEKEVKSVRQSVDNWKKDVNNRSEQIVNDVDRKINNKVGALVKVKKELREALKT